MIIDTHSHLDGEEFADDLPEVIQRAKDAQVEKILVPNVNLQGLPHLIEVCDAYPDYLYPMIGLHPVDVKDDYQTQLDQMFIFLKENPNRFCAIGEVGLDFYWDETYRNQQLEAFEQQIQWAKQFGKPLMIHARNAFEEIVEIMERHRNDQLEGVFHCFTGTEDEARKLLSFDGFKLGIGGVLTFKKSTLPEVLKNAVPLSRIVVETDSPYLAPVPHRGKRNESAFIIEIVRRLTEIYACNWVNIATETKKNAYFLLR
ncbi:MAG: TatD family hydrolase [Bacteroidaceae bacterium]|nr:TatD family hydrolase [Bacteroidaceae bacterium]